VDNDSDKIASLKNGEIPIYEPGLAEIVRHNEKLGRLHFTTELKEGIDNSLIIFLAVGTPAMPDGSADISAILSVAAGIGENLTDYRIIATKSTVPIGTYKKVTDIMKSKTEAPFDYVSNPEFLKEGAAVEDFMRPDRIIIGTTNPANVEQVRQGIGSDSRIGRSFLFPGVGFGGSCLPKDIRALIHTGAEHGVEMMMAKSVQQVNINQQERFAKRVKDYFAGRENKTVLAVWGLSFKAKTDDVRESPAIYCISKFLDCQMKIKAYDPEANEAGAAALDGRIDTFQNGYDALDDADALVIFTDWQEFRNPDFERIKSKLKKPVIFDGRNLHDPSYLKKQGIEYHSIGRV